MNKHVPWLVEQLESWVSAGIVSREQAERIRRLYPDTKAALPWGTIIFSGLGAVIIGLGVILLLAYNWKVMPKEAKLGLIFLSLSGAHLAGIRMLQRPDWGRQLGEALGVLGTMLFGAGIWLVAQIYHIDEHFPNGFLVWGLGALAMAWALPSLAQGILAMAVLSVWSCAEAWGFDTPIHGGPWLILLGVGGLACWRSSPLLLFFSLAGFSLTLIANMSMIRSGLVIPVVMNFSALFLALRILLGRLGWFAGSGPAWAFFGWLGFLSCTYVLSFHGLADDVLDWGRGQGLPLSLAAWMYVWVPFVVMTLAWVATGLSWFRRGDGHGRPHDCSMETWLVPLSALACIVFSLIEMPNQETVAAGVFNLVALALAATWMARGCRRAELGFTILGSLLLSLLVLGRYFDLLESLAWRGVVFVLVGGLLFTEGLLYTRARRRLRKEGTE